MRMKTTMLAALLLTGLSPVSAQVPAALFGPAYVASEGKVYAAGEMQLRAETGGSNGLLINNGTITLEKGIKLYSNEDADGMLFNFSNNIDISKSDAKDLQVIKEFGEDRWYFMSFPFDVNISDVYSPNKAGLTYATTSSNGDFWITYYDGERRSKENSNTGNWKLKPAGEVLKAGVGYQVNLLNMDLKQLVFPAASKKIVSEDDALNINNRSMATSPWNVQGTTRSAHRGWNYLGLQNMGTFRLSAYTMLPEGEFNNTVYYYDNTTRDWNYTDIEDNEMIMPPYFSFLIQAEESTGKFTFDPSGLDEASSGQPQFRSATVPAEKVELQLAGNAKSSRVTFRFSDRYSESPSIAEDGTKLFSINGTDIWSRMQDEALCLNRLPFYADYKELLLGVNTPAAGHYTISLNNAYEGNYAGIMLWDKELDVRTNLLEGAYDFQTDQALNGTGRFSLELNLRAATGIDDAQNHGLWAYVQANNLVVKGTSAGDRVSVYDAAGRLAAQSVSDGAEVVFPLQSRGAFIVKVTGASTAALKVMN